MRLVFSKFIEVWRTTETSTHRKQLLLSNASHEGKHLHYFFGSTIFMIPIARTPLNAIINYLEIALERPLDGSTRDILRKSHTASVSLVYAIEDLLCITEAKNEHPSLIEVGFDIQDAFREVLEPLLICAQSQKLECSIIKHSEVPNHVRGDIQRFQQIIMQIVSNAIQFTTEGSIVVEFSLISKNDAHCLLKIEVRDTGIGLSEEDLDEIFQDLEQIPIDQNQSNATTLQDLERSEKHVKTAKLGLGLSIVARYVKLRNGQLRMKSEPSKGTSVSLILAFPLGSETLHPFQAPVWQFTPPEESALDAGMLQRERSFFDRPIVISLPPASSPISSEILTPGPVSDLVSQPMIVLIADDNTVNLQILDKRLKRMRHQVLVSRNGQECFDVFERYTSSIQFILMDIEVSF
jgi:CheY-like chemotaxis protein